ncbi:MAG: exosortase/archaeosortase family protein, partial [Planctomycetes bacterium]|nr:exosortase/archaeosortase family protein [Planctomycetota bacterium]
GEKTKLGASDWAVVVALAGLALFIWLRDPSWLGLGVPVEAGAPTLADSIPLFAALPLFWLLGRPWRLQPPARPGSTGALTGAVASLALGIPTGLTLLLALGWTLLLWWWLSPRLSDSAADDQRVRVRRLLILPLMAFPWVTLDGQGIGNFFRLTGAATTAWVYDGLGYPVTREGTSVFIADQEISVEAACAGLNTLQSLLVMGTLAAGITLGRHRRFWLSLPLLVLAAWVGNTARIIGISAIALGFGAEAARGWAHDWGGWAVLMATFLATAVIFELMSPRRATVAPPPATPPAGAV